MLSQLPQKSVTRWLCSGRRSLSLISPEEYSNRKGNYQKKVKELRKEWAADHKKKQEIALEKKRQEVERVILQKAIRLRAKREDSAARQALKKYNNERAEVLYKEHLAKLKIIREKKAAIQRKRFESLSRSLEAESKYWVTPENMDTKITEELFNKPCTTGVVNKSSEFWRHYARCTNMNRLLFGVLPNMKDEDTINDVILERTQGERATKEDIMGTLNSMIGTGEDRERFDELVDDFSSFTSSIGGRKRKPVNYNSTPDVEKMKRDDYLNLFERGENEYEDKLVHEKIDQLVDGSGEDDISTASFGEDDSDEDLNISENDFHMDDEAPPSPQVATIPDVQEVETTYFEAEEEAGEEYSTAEYSELDALIEDLEYIDEDNEEALYDAYEKIKSEISLKHRD